MLAERGDRSTVSMVRLHGVISPAMGPVARPVINLNNLEPVLKRAFEPYVTTKPRGTGLGLVIVKKIVEEHGGEVALANVAPRGARVTITFPTAAAYRAAHKSAA